jgi:hypothetical protein
VGRTTGQAAGNLQHVPMYTVCHVALAAAYLTPDHLRVAPHLMTKMAVCIPFTAFMFVFTKFW